MNYYQTDAIVLKRENIFEADRLYFLYTKDFGRVKAVAGSTQKINSKLAGHLEPLNLIHVELATKKNGDLFITTALSYNQLLSPNASPAQITLFFKMADLALKMLIEPQKDAVLWDFIIKSFLDAKNVETDTEIFWSDFKNHFISILGFGDDFDKAKYYLGDFMV